MDVTGIILAGGKSLRFGRNKAVENIAGTTLIERVARQLSAITGSVILVVDTSNNSFSQIPAALVAADVYPGKGPLGGIYTGLCSSHTAANILVACDMPFLNTALLTHMVNLLPGYDAVIPRWQNGQIEPLHGIYSTACIPVMKKRLENNRLSISECLQELRVLYLDEQEFIKFDPDFLSFFNINNQADIERLEKIEAAKAAKQKK
jgi:molybdopterin-guanine dinucleotide biosynthesis protein A